LVGPSVEIRGYVTKFLYLDKIRVTNVSSVVDYEGISSKYGRIFLWTTPRFYTPMLLQKSIAERRYLEGVAGPFDSFVKANVAAGTVEKGLGLLRMYTPFKT